MEKKLFPRGINSFLANKQKQQKPVWAEPSTIYRIQPNYRTYPYKRL